MAKIIGFINPKGGVGKSMLASNTAVELFDLGYAVAFIDAEDGGATIGSLEKVEPDIRACRARTLEEIDDSVLVASRQSDIVIIDTPGQSGDAVTAVCLLADIVILPIQASRRDLRQVKGAIRCVKLSQVNRPNLAATFVLNFTRKRDRAASAFTNQLQTLGVSIAEHRIRRLDHYRDHDVVMRDPKLDLEGAATDIRLLIDETIRPHLGPKRAANE